MNRKTKYVTKKHNLGDMIAHVFQKIPRTVNGRIFIYIYFYFFRCVFMPFIFTAAYVLSRESYRLLMNMISWR